MKPQKNIPANCLSCPRNASCSKDKTAVHQTPPKNGRIEKINEKLNQILSGRISAPLSFLFLLSVILFLTIAAANFFSAKLDYASLKIISTLTSLAKALPEALHKTASLVIEGALGTTLTVLSVMLPPALIFFPFFTILDESGILSRVAAMSEPLFKRIGAGGEQAGAILAGLGCNAVAVSSCESTENPTHRKIAVLTNVFTPCNGRLPIIISSAAAFSSLLGFKNPLISTAAVVLTLSFSLSLTIVSSAVISKFPTKKTSPTQSTTAHRESKPLPPCKIPQFTEIFTKKLLKNIADITKSAAKAAAPCGIILYLANNITVGEASLLRITADLLSPVGKIMGLDGTLIISLIAALPANELMLPTAFSAAGCKNLTEYLTQANLSAVNVIPLMILTISHSPCLTTLQTTARIFGKRTAAASSILPTAIGFALCAIANLILGIA